MNTFNQIQKQKKTIARSEKELAETKLKKRRADTRRKIELGGLVIKSGFSKYDKAIILGALNFALLQIQNNPNYEHTFNKVGNDLFNL